MTTYNHSPISTGAAANASTFNSPMGELDAAIGNLENLTTSAKGSAVVAVNELDGEIGNLASLTTTAKSTVVAAINEVDGDVGNLALLNTTQKGSAVAAINELKTNVGDMALDTAATNLTDAINELHGQAAEKILVPIAYAGSTLTIDNDNDAGAYYELFNSGAVTITLNNLSDGVWVRFSLMSATGSVKFVAASGNVRHVGGFNTCTNQYGHIWVIKTSGVGNEWLLVGDLDSST